AGLNDTVVLASGLDDLPALPNLVRNWLFDVDVFAGLNCPNGAERVPMVGRGEGDRIDFFILQQFADVGVAFYLFADFSSPFDLALQDVLIDVTKRDESCPLEFADFFKVIF